MQRIHSMISTSPSLLFSFLFLSSPRASVFYGEQRTASLYEMCSAERQVEETMRRAFWDVLDEKLRAEPPDYSHALVLLDEIRQVRACPASPTSAPLRLLSRRTSYS